MAEIIHDIFFSMQDCFTPSEGYTDESLRNFEQDILSFNSFESIEYDKRNMANDNKILESEFKNSINNYKALLVNG